MMYLGVQVLDGHNGSAAAMFTKDNLLNNVVSSVPAGLSREEWLAALPRAMVEGFVKTDKDWRSKGTPDGTLLGTFSVTTFCLPSPLFHVVMPSTVGASTEGRLLDVYFGGLQVYFQGQRPLW